MRFAVQKPFMSANPLLSSEGGASRLPLLARLRERLFDAIYAAVLLARRRRQLPVAVRRHGRCPPVCPFA